MSHPHHFGVGCSSGHLQRIRNPHGRQGVVTTRVEVGRKPGEDPPGVVAELARLAVQKRSRLPDLSAERLES